MRKGEQEPEKAPKEGEPPAEFPMSVQEFARTYSRGRDTELMGGFIHFTQYGSHPEWADATLSVWIERFEAYRAMPTA
jgi:hypothetical protein